MPQSEGPRWLPQARCHFERLHESHWEKGELWRCKWCEEFLKEFHVKGRVEGDPEKFWCVNKYNGHVWKIRGTESFRPGAWNIKEAMKNYRDVIPKKGF